MPSRWEVHLPGIDPDSVTPERLHAVVAGWFDTTAGAHQDKLKAYSASARPAGTATVIEVGLVDDTLVDRLYTSAGVGARVRVGYRTVVLDADPRQTNGVPWTQLHKATTATAWGLHVHTPATFRRGNTFTPNPAPKAILGGLRRVWQTFAPKDLSALVLELTPEPVWLTDITVTSAVLRVNGRVMSAFTGRIRFACDTTAQTAAAVDRLVRLAPYSGIGAYTGWGFGTVRTDTTRPGPTLPSAGVPTTRPAEPTWACC
jgi:CRISPR-associated endoribonuclease Cas6